MLNYPSVMNFIGGVKGSQNITGFQHLTLPPYAQSGLSAELLLDGKTLGAEQSMWHPCELRRKSSVNGVNLESTMRMPFEQQGVFIRLAISNTTKKARTLKLSMNGIGRARVYPPQQWRTWGNRRPNDSSFVAAVTKEGKALIVSDKMSSAVSVYAFSRKPGAIKANGASGDIEWTITLAPGKSEVIELAYAIGNTVEKTTNTAYKWASSFKMEFDLAKSKWEERWQASFKPGNKHFSGHYPKLITDDPKIRRVYYQGVFSSNCHSGFPHPWA